MRDVVLFEELALDVPLAVSDQIVEDPDGFAQYLNSQLALLSRLEIRLAHGRAHYCYQARDGLWMEHQAVESISIYQICLGCDQTQSSQQL